MVATIELGDGTTRDIAVGDDGVLDFIVDKRKQTLTLGLQTGEEFYIASESGGAGGERHLTTKSAAANLARDGWRIFRLPQTLDLDNADWAVDASVASTYNKPTFEQLETLDEIGSHGAPCVVELDPHWQYLKLLYFDRKLKTKLSLPPLVLEGFVDKDDAAGEPDTQSNWMTDPEACQCLPWILRKKDDGSALEKPDADVLLQCRTKDDTFVDSSAGDASGGGRKLVTGNAGSPGEDPGLNEGENSAVDFDLPNAERIAFYDLPPVWKSRTYFARLGGNSDRFENLAANATTDAQPVLFSLDDIVLTGPDLAPIAWTPDGTVPNRFALFVNTFASGTDLTTFGLYKHDGLSNTANNRGYFTQQPSGVETDRNYIADYPDWTRLVITQGNLFDCFDKRVADDPNGVVGARAGVRWVDGTPSGVGVATGGNHPTPALVAAATHPFYAAQPFYRQEFFNRGVRSRTGTGNFDEWNSPIAAGEALLAHVGRFDLALLRCCDLDADNEVAVAFRYYRYVFDFTAQTSLLTPATATRRQQWADHFLSDCAERWNGDETARGGTAASVPPGRDADNTDRTLILPKDAAVKLKVPIISFLQHLDDSLSHFKIDTIQESGTSSMSSGVGTGNLRVNAGFPKTTRNFAGAHETGHAGGLPDEYPRRPASSLGQASFGSNHVPGAAFSMDSGAMMVFNRPVRARYLWNTAEWMRTIPALASTEFKLDHGAEKYELPHYQHQATRPYRNYVYWPVKADLRHNPIDPTLYDSYLYMLGADRHSTHGLIGSLRGSAATGEPAGRIDGMLVVVIKVRFNFGGWTGTGTRPRLAATRINRKVDRALNYRTLAQFTVASNPDAPPEFKKCLLHISLRFDDRGSNQNEHMVTRVRPSGSTSFRGTVDPRRQRVALAGSAPAAAPAVQGEFDRLGDEVFKRCCELLGLSDNPADANAYTKANAYRDIVRSVAGAAVNPTLTRRS